MFPIFFKKNDWCNCHQWKNELRYRTPRFSGNGAHWRAEINTSLSFESKISYMAKHADSSLMVCLLDRIYCRRFFWLGRQEQAQHVLIHLSTFFRYFLRTNTDPPRFILYNSFPTYARSSSVPTESYEVFFDADLAWHFFQINILLELAMPSAKLSSAPFPPSSFLRKPEQS